MASADAPDVTLRLVRLGHDGGAPTRTPVPADAPAGVRVPHATLDSGSYGVVEGVRVGDCGALMVWLWPTRLRPGAAIAHLDAADGSLAVLLGEGGAVEATAAAGGREARVRVAAGLRERRWALVWIAWSPGRLSAGAVLRDPLACQRRSVAATATAAPTPGGGRALLHLACRPRPDGTDAHLDGKLAAPIVLAHAVDDDDAREIAATLGAAPAGASHAWDMGADAGSARVADRIGGRHGTLHNLPTRGMTDQAWDGSCLAHAHAPRGYGAVHFHADDLADARWARVAEAVLPDDARSGVYAVELATARGADATPFVVRRRRGAPPAPLLVLAPTLTYVAYANEHCRPPGLDERCDETAAAFARDNRLHSLYDSFADGSGVSIVSMRRPLLGMRDDHRFRYSGCEHCLGADLHLLGWLDRQGLAYDVASDLDLDRDGAALLEGHRALVTGSHPEYWTAPMLHAVDCFLDGGGRLAYLGGNGFYWVTAVDQARGLVEIRRGRGGIRTWDGEPGEDGLASTGEPGTTWGARGRHPAALVGVEPATMGFVPGSAYRRLADSYDPRAARVFAGVGEEPIGEDGLVLGAAAGYETDIVHPRFGTPPGTLRLAEALLPDGYIVETGESFAREDALDGPPRRRADMVLLETAAGGAVFSVGSVAWCGALPIDGDRNPVSRITRNVLEWFAEGELWPTG